MWCVKLLEYRIMPGGRGRVIGMGRKLVDVVDSFQYGKNLRGPCLACILRRLRVSSIGCCGISASSLGWSESPNWSDWHKVQVGAYM